MACHSLLQGTTLCQTSPPWPDRLGWPHTARLSLTESDKAVVLGSDWLVFCDYGFSVSALWCPLAAPTVLLGFLLPRTWGISSRLLQQSAAAAPYLGWGVPSHGRPSWPWTGSSSSQPSSAPQPPLLGGGAALPAAAPDLRGVVVRRTAAPDLRRGVAPLGAPALSQPDALGRRPDLGRGVAPHSHASARVDTPISLCFCGCWCISPEYSLLFMPAACLLIFQDLPQKISHPLCIAFLNAFRYGYYDSSLYLFVALFPQQLKLLEGSHCIVPVKSPMLSRRMLWGEWSAHITHSPPEL